MGAVVVIGNFDGVHRGHRALLTNAARIAEQGDLGCIVLTFTPHPLAALGRTPPAMLTTQARKRELIERLADDLLVRSRAETEPAASLRFVEQPFDRTFAAQSPEQFARWLVDAFAARVVMVGENFRFGHGREGSFATLVALGRALGFDARAEPLVTDESGTISSTRVRAAIASGNMAAAETLLGRPHSFSGVVTTGKKLGRTIGFPTANLTDIPELLPPYGVYAVRVDRLDGTSAEPLGHGAMSIGVNPTTDASVDTKVEIFVFDRVEAGRVERGFSGDLYGAHLRVHVVRRLRGEEKFDGLASLVAQIARDVEDARAVLEDRAS